MADSDDEWGNWADCERARASQRPVFGASTLCSAGAPPSTPAQKEEARAQVQAVQNDSGVRGAIPAAGTVVAASSDEPAAKLPKLGPQKCHVTLLRDKRKRERLRREAEKERKAADLAAAKALLAKKQPRRKLGEDEKKARAAARRLVRACEKTGKHCVPGSGSTEVQPGLGVQARVTRGRGELSNAHNLQQTLHSPSDIDISGTTSDSSDSSG